MINHHTELPVLLGIGSFGFHHNKHKHPIEVFYGPNHVNLAHIREIALLKREVAHLPS